MQQGKTSSFTFAHKIKNRLSFPNLLSNLGRMNADAFCPHDPFKQARESEGVLPNDFDGETIPMILRHNDVRAAAKDWRTFSSDDAFHVPIPQEECVRSVRQLPIETDPPIHTEYRKIVEPFFRRALKPEMIEQVEQLIGDALIDAVARDSIEIVRDFALPIQSRALAILLNVPSSEAERWIRWGIHVFRDPKTGEKGSLLDSYIQEKLNRAEKEPSEDFFSALTQATFRGRSLARGEMEGFANLTFAGGRDTVINTITCIIAYFSYHIQKLDSIRKEPKLIPSAAEEFVRVITPLTHIGRKCPVDTEVADYKVAANERISLCWASANFDETVFDSPEEVRLDRRPNPHIAYGAGTHICLGAPHARLIIRSLLKKLSEHIGGVELIEFDKNVEREAQYQRKVGYQSLVVRLNSRTTSH